MNKFTVAIFMLFPVLAHSQEVYVPDVQVMIEEHVPFFAPEPSFNENEKRALDVNKKLLEERLPSQPADTGGIEFVYGQGMPVVVCRPLRLCVIALEKGENVEDVMIGDPRWKVQPSVSGKHPAHQVHAIVKPSDVGIETSLMISTDRRVYNMTLKSSGDKYMPRVSFTYPGSDTNSSWKEFIEDQVAQIEEMQIVKANAKAQTKRELEQIENGLSFPPRLGVDVDDLNFSYTIRGDFAFRPTRVFDDGIHTYVDLPDSALSGDVPVLVVSPFDKGNEIVNYRLKENRYIIDGLTTSISLLRDVGGKQKRVKIIRN